MNEQQLQLVTFEQAERLKEKMDVAAADYLDENGLLVNYYEDNYAAGIRDGFWEGASAMYAELMPIIEMITHNFRHIAQISERLSSGNVSHARNTIIGIARRNEEYLKKHLL